MQNRSNFLYYLIEKSKGPGEFFQDPIWTSDWTWTWLNSTEVCLDVFWGKAESFRQQRLHKVDLSKVDQRRTFQRRKFSNFSGQHMS